MQRLRIFAAAAGVLALAACGDGRAEAAASSGGALSAAPAAAPATGQTVVLGDVVAPSGTVHQIRMVTDEKGNYFEPEAIRAKKGDVLRFTLSSAVHNVHFAPEQNPGVAGLPGPSPLLQVPADAYEVVVGLSPGTYRFRCDPHVALEMVGTLTVE